MAYLLSLKHLDFFYIFIFSLKDYYRYLCKASKQAIYKPILINFGENYSVFYKTFLLNYSKRLLKVLELYINKMVILYLNLNMLLDYI